MRQGSTGWKHKHLQTSIREEQGALGEEKEDARAHSVPGIWISLPLVPPWLPGK